MMSWLCSDIFFFSSRRRHTRSLCDWSSDVCSSDLTESCQVRHVGVVQSGRMGVRHEDGTEVEIESGEVYVIEPGHDAWVAGDERVVAYEFESRAAEEYAKG